MFLSDELSEIRRIFFYIDRFWDVWRKPLYPHLANFMMTVYVMLIQGVEHVICDVVVRHFINIVAAAILQLLSTSMIQISSALHLFKR